MVKNALTQLVKERTQILGLLKLLSRQEIGLVNDNKLDWGEGGGSRSITILNCTAHLIKVTYKDCKFLNNKTSFGGRSNSIKYKCNELASCTHITVQMKHQNRNALQSKKQHLVKNNVTTSSAEIISIYLYCDKISKLPVWSDF